ncbi:MAG: hypothetical protein ACRCV3_05530 [Desulfovibrionaceae bacterium]
MYTLADFITIAVKGNDVIFKDDVLQEIENNVQNNATVSMQEEHSNEDHVRTILAFIESFGREYDSNYAHIATLLLSELIQHKKRLSYKIILYTYQNIVDINILLEDDFPSFLQLSLAKQKMLLDVICLSPTRLSKKTMLVKGYLLSNLLASKHTPIIA